MPKLYKFLNKGLVSKYGNFKWEIGKWYKEESINMCDSGFHASKNPAHAFSYVQGEVLALVEVKGKSEVGDDKQCWSDMRIVKAWKWEQKDYVSFAIYAAEQVISILEKEYPNDQRPRKAIEAAKAYLENPTKENKDAAYAAAYAAYAADAAYAAYAADAADAADAAYAAARAAACAADAADAADAAYAAADAADAACAADAADAADAAYAAADAADAAYAAADAADAACAADAAMWKKLGNWMEERIKTLEEIK